MDVGVVARQILNEMIGALPEGYMTVLNLFAFERISHKEIGRQLGISESTSASQLHRARMLLMQKVKEYNKKIICRNER